MNHFYDSYFLVKPIVGNSGENMHFLFEAKVNDEALIKILMPQSKKQVDSLDNIKKQSQMNDTQKTWMSGAPVSTLTASEIDSIKIPKCLVDT